MGKSVLRRITMYYSVLIETSEGTGKNKKILPVIESDYSNLEKIKSNVLVPYFQGEKFLMDGYFLNKSQISRIKIVSSEKSIQSLVDLKEQESFFCHPCDPYQIINDPKLVDDITDEILNEVQQKLTNLKTSTKKNKKSTFDNKRVFIVHGHDDKVKLDVSNFLRKLGLEPVILHEQANQGKTIIEKIEDYTNVGYGIVLYTPCDKGGTAATDFENMKFRARQNVIFEHGYLIAKLGRNRVCALVDGDIELPSDIGGVLYVTYPSDWELKVGKELLNVGYNINLNNL